MDAARAGSAQEFRAKYEGKRITKKAIAKLPLISVLYHFLYPKEAYSEEGEIALYPKFTEKLNSLDSEEAEEVQIQAARYESLISWAYQERRVAQAYLEAANNAILNASQILDSTKQAEDIRHYAGYYIAQSPEAAEAFSSLSIIDLDGMLWSDGNGWALPSAYRNISQNMLHAVVYNAIVRYIAEEIQIPEFDQMQASLQHTIDGLNLITQAVDNLKEAIAYRYDETEAPEDSAKGFKGDNGIYHDKTHALSRRALNKVKPQLLDVDSEYDEIDKSIKKNIINSIHDILRGLASTGDLSYIIEKRCYDRRYNDG